MMPTRMDRADFLTALGVVALGLGAAVESWRMPRLEQLDINPYTAPGIVPGVIGVVLTALGLALLARSAARGGWRLAAVTEPAPDGRAARLALALALTVGYAAGLVGRLPFWLATGLFVFAFIAVFEWRLAADRTGRLRGLAIAAAEAVAVSAAVTFVFQSIFLVRLP